ncbi:Protein pim1 [Cytospora mali]|uniref:Protein pim1 n=1 Tax=Cytospora mali TaxID=578113 RepID=A0A194UP93_CYTMA|nr:Protein pim1 [Valsa mali var. pyri (nom. inval.)]
MPPKKAVAAVAALAKSIKNGASKKDTNKSTTAKSSATKTATAKKTDTAKSATTKKSAATKDATAKKSAAGKKPSGAAPKTLALRDEPKPRANISRKRKATSEDKENKATTKKTKADTASQKRKATEDAEEQPKKRAKSETTDSNASQSKATPKPAAPKAVTLKIGLRINFAPAQPLDIFVFGEGESGELGLGNKKFEGKKPVQVKRPRLHHLLSAADVGVVQIACGGMHTVALTKDNKILTWGVNDQGALGRDTAWDGGVRDVDAEDSDDELEEFENMNPVESTPAEVNTKNIAPGIKFAKVVASDSASFALTEDGRVYGWGTFRSSDGILGFTKDILVQKEPFLLPESKKIVDIAAGSNHVMTLDNKGKVESWGAPEQNQLGRRVVQRDMKASALRPGGVAFRRGVKITKIACGSYHSFAIDNEGRLYSWGLNNFGELGIENGAGQDSAVVLEPTLVDTLSDYKITQVSGGEHHSIACTEDGKLVAWGRIDGYQTGLTRDKFNEHNTIFDEHNKPRILKIPTVHEGLPHIVSVACGTDNSFAITEDGKAYSWGFSANYQTGQGETEDDVEVPTLIDNTAVRDKKLVYAGAGGQFSVLASIHSNA